MITGTPESPLAASREGGVGISDLLEEAGKELRAATEVLNETLRVLNGGNDTTSPPAIDVDRKDPRDVSLVEKVGAVLNLARVARIRTASIRDAL